MTRLHAILIPAVVAALLACGCSSDPTKGYTMASLYPQDVDSVAVPMWSRGANVYRRENETRLTEAIIKRIELDTPYKVTTQQRADTVLTGTIEAIRQKVLSFNPDTGLPRETEIAFVVSFTWKDLRTGQVRVRQERFEVAGTYVNAAPIGEDYFQGEQDVVNQLAKRIVEQLESSW
jgi:hypothetical protein